jgi:serine/threonine-protein kinase
VTCYEALSGKRAFPGDDAMSVATRVATEDATPIGAFTKVDEVLARAMSKDKDKRFASCATFGDALAAALEQRPALTPAPASLRISMTSTSRDDAPFQPNTSSLVPKQTRRWQNLLAASGVLLILGLVVIGRRQRTVDSGVSMRDLAAEFALALESRSAPTTTHSGRPPDIHTSDPRPRPSATMSASAPASASATPSASASAPPPSAPSASALPPSPTPSPAHADSGAP